MLRPTKLCCLLWLACLAPLAAVESADPDAKPLKYETHIRPILKANCFHCHGEADELEAKLDLRLVRSMLRGGDSGPAIVSGRHDLSLLWQKINSGEMPPGDNKLSTQQRARIARWIDEGAQTVRSEPNEISATAFTEEERAHWSLQKVQQPALPKVKQPQLVRSPIDAFLLHKLEAKSARFSSEADRVTLIRRATFDLLGLPPTPDEIDAFINDSRPDAFEQLVDRLLESPHYGERWGRHWLDVAGYADSEGYNDKDLERKWSFKYRDYVIRAFNADRPWNELLVEQLAGDELIPPPYTNLTSEQAEKLVATGFLRMAPDGTSDAADQNVARNDVIAETIKVVSTSLLGLTVGCAQCHSHRYDPITQDDYYRLRAIFEPALDWKNWRNPASRLISLWTDEQRKLASECDAQVKELEKQRLAEWEQLIDSIREKTIANLDDALKDKIRVAAKTPVAKRSAEQKKLLTEYPKANIPIGLLDRNDKPGYDAIAKRFGEQIDAVKKRRPVDDYAQCLTEVPGKVPPTHLFFRGDFNAPRQEIAPGELSVLGETLSLSTSEPLKTSGRRLAYARHLTSGEHPLVARVFVNRVWLHHFGRGLVATPGDFGTLGQRPSHPELLDWLADDFVRGGWTLKRMHRLLMNSTAYRQSSRRTMELDRIDGDNQLLGRMSIRRLEAETLRDTILAASGKLNRSLYGKAVPVTPDDAGQIIVGVDTRDGAGRPTGKKVPLNGEEFRRSVYVQVRRSMPLAMLDTFDAPALEPNCTLRNSSTVAPQSLLLMNNEFVVEQSQVFARSVIASADPADIAAQVTLAWRRALGRTPSAAERDAAAEYVRQQTHELTTLKTKEPAEHALATFCQALISSNAFLYVD